MTLHQLPGAPDFCEWFALCRRPSAGTVAHPILGAVPTCAACSARFDLGVRCPHGRTVESRQADPCPSGLTGCAL